MDLVTVTWSGDKHLQVMQSYSINKYILTPCIHWIIIEDTAFSLEMWESLLSPYYTVHKLKLIYRKHVIINDDFKCGWHRQQFLKLFVSNFVRSSKYFVLDSKNIFIKPFNMSSIELLDGNGLFHLFENQFENIKWKNWIKHIQDNTNITVPNVFWAVETPFIFKTDIVKNILDNNGYNIFISYDTDIHVSEFILYRFFNQTCNDSFCSMSKTYWPGMIFPDTAELNEEYLNNLTFLITFHKEFLNNLTVFQKKQLCNWFIEKQFPVNLTLDYIFSDD